MPCPVSFHHPFPFALPPLPGSSRFACFGLFPRPRAWDVRANVDLRLRAAGLSACLSSPQCRSLAIARSLFSVGLRSSASLLAWFCRRLCCRVVSYSIPDDTMRITGSCGIRLASLPCLLDVCRRMPRRFAPSSVLVLGCVRSSACLGSCLFPLRLSSSSRRSFRPIASRLSAPPHRHDGRGDTIVPLRFSRLCLLAHRLAIPPVRFGIGWRRGSVPAPLDCPMPAPAPWPSSMLSATRSLAQSDLLIASSSHRLSSPITRHGGRGGGYCSLRHVPPSSCLLTAFLFASFCWTCPSHLPRSSCSLSLRPPASLCLLSPFIVSPGGASLVSPLVMCSARRPCVLAGRSAFRLSSSRRAYRYTECCGDGDLRIGAFVPRFHKLHLLSGASCVSLLQHGVPSFFYFFGSSLLASPLIRVDNRGDVG